jgi:hypothetical protein
MRNLINLQMYPKPKRYTVKKVIDILVSSRDFTYQILRCKEKHFLFQSLQYSRMRENLNQLIFSNPTYILISNIRNYTHNTYLQRLLQ